jgi:hypothetical protein
MTTSRTLQTFNTATSGMVARAKRDGASITDDQINDALTILTSDGPVSAADRAAVFASLSHAPLTTFARASLVNFCANPAPNQPGSSPLSVRLGTTTVAAPDTKALEKRLEGLQQQVTGTRARIADVTTELRGIEAVVSQKRGQVSHLLNQKTDLENKIRDANNRRNTNVLIFALLGGLAGTAGALMEINRYV